MLVHRAYTYSAAHANTVPTSEETPRQWIPGQIVPDDVLSALPWPVAVLDQDGTIIGVNRAWRHSSTEDGTRTLPESGIGLNYFEVSHPGSGLPEEGACEAYEAYEGIREVLAGRLSLFVSEFPYHALGEQRWRQLIVTPLANDPPGALIQHLDITARKLAERERDEALAREPAAGATVARKRWVARTAALLLEQTRLQDERDSAVRERDEATAREWASREASRQMELFMAMAGHEIRTPLAVIKGQIHLAERQLGPMLPAGAAAQASASARKSLDAAQHAANRLASLLDDLLEVTNAKADRLAMHPEWCELVVLVREHLAEQRPLHPSRRMHLHLKGQPHIFILADPVRITEVLANFLNNACKYSPETMPIDVELCVERGEVRMSVRDRGPGLSPDAQARVWGRFYQEPSIKPQSGGKAGLGLGLYITRVIVEQHGGKVGIDSTVGKGATFWCTLPLGARGS
jgi:signal transduction histidine kinase